MDPAALIAQALTSPFAVDDVLAVIWSLKEDGMTQLAAYRLLERMAREAEARGDSYGHAALEGAMQYVAGFCDPAQRIWPEMLAFTDEAQEV